MLCFITNMVPIKKNDEIMYKSALLPRISVISVCSAQNQNLIPQPSASDQREISGHHANRHTHTQRESSWIEQKKSSPYHPKEKKNEI